MKDRSLEFVAEAEELMDEASASLLEMQETLPSPPPDLVNGVFRAMHTLKGMAGLFGYQGLSDISHHLENVLDLVRLGKADINYEVTSFIFRCFDFLRTMLGNIRDGREQDEVMVANILGEIEVFVQNLSSTGGASMDAVSFPEEYSDLLKVLSEYEEHRLKTNIREGRTVYMIRATFPLDEFDVHLKELTEGLRPFGEVISTMPTSDGVPAGSIGFQVMAAGGPDILSAECVSGHDVSVLVETRAQKAPSSPAEPPELQQDTSQSLRASSTNIRVDISKVDSILDTISDLSLSRQAVYSIWRELIDGYGNIPLSIDLYRVAQTMQRRMELLQSQVLEIRMVPVGQIFSRLSQVVKRYSAGAGKRIRLDLYGEDTEIDKYVAEEVVDPLMHTVRNAIDHGIEDQEERLGLGKPPEGLLELRASQVGNSVIITVRDDGRGIDPERVRAKAVERGLISDADVLDRREMLDLLFRPGFSTAESVSETSGRGVGLDVVKEKMSLLGGSVEVSDEVGAGTTFIITLPITLSLIRALVVRVGHEMFAVPLAAMSETFVVERDEIQEVDGSKVCSLRGEMLLLAGMGGLMDLENPELERYFVVVVGHGDKRMGLLMDEFIGQQEIVIKPLGGYFDGVKGYAGASEIGRHKVILVLDVETIINDALKAKRKVLR